MKNLIKKKLGIALAVTLSTVSIATAYTTTTELTNAAPSENVNVNSIRNDEPTADRINEFKDIAMYYYWHGGDIQQAEKEIFKGITLKGKYDVVENAFKEAAQLDPYDLDLKLSLASTQIIQKKTPEALQTYKQILNLDPNHFNANLLHGVYSKVNGDNSSYKSSISNLKQIDSKKANEYLQKLKTTETIINGKLNTSAPSDLPQKDHAIVILGYALADDGTMKETLIERLKAGLSIAKQYPNSKIIVTGGVPKQGITEADAMSNWLISQGIEKDRIILENKSTDTVENALFSTAMLDKEGLKDVTLVTSASHMRRALTVFKEASNFYDKMNGENSDRNFTNVVYLDYPSIEEAHKVSKDEILVIYRDLFRTSGIWQYPGLQR
ncbi:ElyC/SanA/YdcF family protein [Domibacillus sp. DTU_2020_1001157_1_SI_ALB_TIR_016]|uniref:ElyC/SanA/YdcF family protein n=1 Tax=Domibacillus sp. DTU_2020_1001157_1_SI_ALB_TIR_016 TaxID=3077789 RepID=UPI0028E23781|nr:ElyC/SanA/YdcF family protein [Domibacillus sp. DTU_2020_1001157_1_SI_ALB_TIR_016]WNS79201.1 ElyC/SanA/YdcF family protein [Domibacillus sp. DTU_2020_1001157_1_SI_ALB_TIR_016]